MATPTANSRPRLSKIACPAAPRMGRFSRSGWPNLSSRAATGSTAIGSIRAPPILCSCAKNCLRSPVHALRPSGRLPPSKFVPDNLVTECLRLQAPSPALSELDRLGLALPRGQPQRERPHSLRGALLERLACNLGAVCHRQLADDCLQSRNDRRHGRELMYSEPYEDGCRHRVGSEAAA